MRKSEIINWYHGLNNEWLQTVEELGPHYHSTYVVPYFEEVEGILVVGLEFHYGDWQQDCYTRMAIKTKQLSIPTLLKIKQVWEECIDRNG